AIASWDLVVIGSLVDGCAAAPASARAAAAAARPTRITIGVANLELRTVMEPSRHHDGTRSLHDRQRSRADFVRKSDCTTDVAPCRTPIAACRTARLRHAPDPVSVLLHQLPARAAVDPLRHGDPRLRVEVDLELRRLRRGVAAARSAAGA